MRFLDLASAAQTIRLSYVPGATRQVLTDSIGESFDPRNIDTVWYRRNPPPWFPTIREDDERRFAISEWACAIEGLLSELPVRFVSNPARQREATKPRQLQAAARVGLCVPDTLITNDRQLATAFVAKHHGKVVHKVLSPTEHFFPDTRRFDDHARAALENLSLAPTMFQEEILGSTELRITIVGKSLYTAKIGPDTNDDRVDSRLNLDRPYTSSELPSNVERPLLALMEELGLLFGTVDMKINENGEHVFFEVNPQGQFLYVEILTGLRISQGVAEFLASDTSGEHLDFVNSLSPGRSIGDSAR